MGVVKNIIGEVSYCQKYGTKATIVERLDGIKVRAILNDDENKSFVLGYDAFKKGSFIKAVQKYERLGQEFTSSWGDKFKIVEYKDATHVKIQFQDEHQYEYWVTYYQCLSGEVKNPYRENPLITQQRKERINTISYSPNGTKAIIKEYVNSNKVLVEFQDEYKHQYWTSFDNFRDGMLTNPYESRTHGGTGFIGVGKYNSVDHVEAYGKWKGILERTNPDKLRVATASYEGCEMCEEWYNFQNFAEWYYSNKYDFDGKLCIDKDIKFHGNKIYSPETCILVPERINLLFIKECARRGDLPIGVQRKKDKYTSQVNKIHLGIFNSQLEAFSAYKSAKEKYIKEILFEYKNIIPKDIYEIIYNYKVEITD